MNRNKELINWLRQPVYEALHYLYTRRLLSYVLGVQPHTTICKFRNLVIVTILSNLVMMSNTILTRSPKTC